MNYLPIILRIVAILSAFVAGALYFLSEGKLDEKEKELTQVRTELKALLDKNELSHIEISQFKEDLMSKDKLIEEAKGQLEEAQAELVAEMQESQRVQKKLVETQRKVAQLEETASSLRKELLSTERSLVSTSKEGVIAQLNERIEELTAENAQLRGKIQVSEPSPQDSDSVATESEISDDDSAQSIVQKKLTPDEVSKIKEETRIASLSIANGLIVLDAGKELKLKSGMAISLLKGLEVVAQVEIININGSLAIAHIKPGSKLEGLSKGDTVKILR